MKLRILPVFVLIFTTTFIMLACDKTSNKRHVIHGSWKIDKKNVPIGDINQVMLFLPGDLYVDIGEKPELRIEADDNILPFVVPIVSNELLNIKPRTHCYISGQRVPNISLDNPEERNEAVSPAYVYPRRRIKYYLTVNNLKSIVALSNSRVTVPQLTGDRVIIFNGSSDFFIEKVSGKEVKINDSSSINFYKEYRRLGDYALRYSISSPKRGMEIGSLSAEKLDVVTMNNLYVHINNGEVKRQIVTVAKADYYAPKVRSIEAYITMFTSGNGGRGGDANVSVSKRLVVYFGAYSGNVYYNGDPEITVTYEDEAKVTGKLIKITN